MKLITTNDGSQISVDNGVDEATITILKAAPVFRHSHFVYTGNSSAGQDHESDELENFLRSSGLQILESSECEDDFTILTYWFDSETGIQTLKHRGKTLTYHAQGRKGENHGQFGYTWRAEYRLISCK